MRNTNLIELKDASPDKELTCPICKSVNVEKRHHSGSFAAPECNYLECEDCGEQWDHA